MKHHMMDIRAPLVRIGQGSYTKDYHPDPHHPDHREQAVAQARIAADELTMLADEVHPQARIYYWRELLARIIHSAGAARGAGR